MLNKKEIEKYINKLLKTYRLRRLKQIFTPDLNKKTISNFQKYSFISKTIFKGKLTKILLAHYHYKSIEEIEKVLNKIYSKKELIKIYDIYKLQIFSIDVISKGKDKFALVFLGLMCEILDESSLEKFIYANYIEEHDYLFPKKTAQKETDIELFNRICKMKYKVKSISKLENRNNECVLTILINNIPYITSISKSYKYVYKKAYKSALKKIMEEPL